MAPSSSLDAYPSYGNKKYLGGDEASKSVGSGRVQPGQASPRERSQPASPSHGSNSRRSGGYPVQQAKRAPAADQSRGSGVRSSTDIKSLLNRVSELEQAMNFVHDDNTALREQVSSLTYEAEVHRADADALREQVVNRKGKPLAGSNVSSTTTASSSRAPEAWSSSKDAARRGGGTGIASPSRKSFAADPSTLCLSPSAMAPQQNLSPRSHTPKAQRIDAKESRYEATIPRAVGAQFYLEHSQEWQTGRIARDPRSYVSRLAAENHYRFAMGTANVKTLEKCLQDTSVTVADDTERYLEVHRAYEDRTRRALVRRATAAKEHARCKIQQLLDHDRSALPRSCQWTNRSDELKAFAQAMKFGQTALQLCDEAGVEAEKVIHLMEDVQRNLCADAIEELEKAMQTKNTKFINRAVREAQMVGLDDDHPVLRKAEHMLNKQEPATSSVGPDLDDADSILMALKEKIDRLKMRVVQFYQVYNTDRNGRLDYRELRAALSDLAIPVSDTGFRNLIAQIDPRGTGSLTVKELARALAGSERQPSARRRSTLVKVSGLPGGSPNASARSTSPGRRSQFGSLDAYWLGGQLDSSRTAFPFDADDGQEEYL